MKIHILLLILSIFLFADQDLIHLLEDEKIFHVSNVSHSDSLNLRTQACKDSNIITTIPYNGIVVSSKLCSSKKKKIKNGWRCIQYYNFTTKKNYTGWVNKKYLSLLNTWKKYKTKYMILYYPTFLILENNYKLHFLKHTQYRYKQYKDGRDGIVEMGEMNDFDMTLKLYDSFQEALKENYLVDGYDFNKSTYNTNEPVQKIKEGYSIRTGVEGVGEIYFIQTKHNKTLVGVLKYNKNHITPLQKSTPFLINYQQSIELAKKIMLKAVIIHTKTKEYND